MLVLEHNNQSVEIVIDKESTFFYPKFDLSLSNDLFEEFNQIVVDSGLIEHWRYEGYYLYPTLLEELYWNFFVYIVAHNQAYSFIKDKKFKIKKNKHYVVGGLSRMLSVLSCNNKITGKIAKNIATYFMSLVARDKKACVALLDDGNTSFRYKFLEKVLSSRFRYAKIVGISSIFCLFNKPLILKGYKCIRYKKIVKDHQYNSANLLKKYISQDEFDSLVRYINQRSQDIVSESHKIRRQLGKSSISSIVSYDNLSPIASVLLAAKLNKIRFISYQHGVLTKFSYRLSPGYLDRRYSNLVPNNMVVWGNYWREVLVKYSNIKNKDFYLIGSRLGGEVNLSLFDNTNSIEHNVNILIPYEFLSDYRGVSRYIRMFIDYGWNVVVKTRPDANKGELPFDQYMYDHILIKSEINPSDFDVVVCTQSTFAYEMMQYGLSIWYLDTNFSMLEDIALNGYAHLLDLDILARAKNDEILKKLLKPLYSLDDVRHCFSDRTMCKTLEMAIL